MTGVSALVLVGASIAAAALIIRPVWALYIQALSLPFQAVFVIQMGANLKISEIVGVLTILGWMFSFIAARRDLARPLTQMVFPAVLLIVVLALSLVQTARRWDLLTATQLTSVTGVQSGRQSPHMRSFITFAWAVYSVLMFAATADLLRQRKALRRMVMFLFASSTLAGVYAFYKLLFLNVGLPPLWLPGDITTGWARQWAIMRSDGTFMEPATLANYYIVVIPLTLAAWSIERKPLFVAALGVQLLALISSFSPGGWVTFIIAMAMYIPFLIHAAKLPIASVVRIALGATMLTILVGWAAITIGKLDTRAITLNLYEKVTGTAVANEADLSRANASSRTARVELAKIAWEMWRRNPVMGVGIGNFPFLHQYYARELRSGYVEDVTVTPSVLYLLILSETGIVGLVGFAAFGVQLMRLLYRAASRAADREILWMTIGVIGSIFGILANGLVLDNPFANYYWLVAGIGAAAASVSRSTDRLQHVRSAAADRAHALARAV